MEEKDGARAEEVAGDAPRRFGVTRLLFAVPLPQRLERELRRKVCAPSAPAEDGRDSKQRRGEET